jgi:hypothetical protein
MARRIHSRRRDALPPMLCEHPQPKDTNGADHPMRWAARQIGVHITLNQRKANHRAAALDKVALPFSRKRWRIPEIHRCTRDRRNNEILRPPIRCIVDRENGSA